MMCPMCKAELVPEDMIEHTAKCTGMHGAVKITIPTEKDTNNIVETLQERGKEYGKFADHAVISQDIKFYMRKCRQWHELRADQQEALEMIAHKTARILNGNPNNVDSWHDIAGYATLIADRLRGTSR